MTELDFEELDKAVTSLMEAPEATPPVEPTPAPMAESPTESVESPATGEPEDAMKSAPRLAVKRSGRFMDVVHPSSDMRSTDKPVSREAKTIISPDPSFFQEALAQELSIQPNNALEFQETPTDAQPPLTSPFLPDAQVEKRPLGSLSTVPEPSDTNENTQEATPPTHEPVVLEPSAELSAAASSESSDQSDTPLPSEAIEQPALPEELGSDLLAIESSGTPDSITADVDESAPELASLSNTEEVPLATDMSASSSPPPETLFAHSIPQQYEEQPSSADPTHAAIYDEQAPQPLAHPSKKKTGWLVILWIILLIVVGAGGAAALYFGNLLR